MSFHKLLALTVVLAALTVVGTAGAASRPNAYTAGLRFCQASDTASLAARFGVPADPRVRSPRSFCGPTRPACRARSGSSPEPSSWCRPAGRWLLRVRPYPYARPDRVSERTTFVPGFCVVLPQTAADTFRMILRRPATGVITGHSPQS
jgi:hypothetical protein